ncbi:MAG: NAD(P)H-hydrate dehydratase [Gemmatimonadaceae bacterium]
MSPERSACSLRVTTAPQAALRDARAIAHGIPSFTLMAQAGTQSAAAILRDHRHRLAHGVAVFAGTGNNGGDAWMVAAQLARAGVRVRVVTAGAPRTADAQQAAALAHALPHDTGRLTVEPPTGAERLVVDGLLGTGHTGAFRDTLLPLVRQLAAVRAAGATVIALDLPSGMDAATGVCCAGSVPAEVTHSYGTVKRGLLLNRPAAGRILLLDIGLGDHAGGEPGDTAWETPAAHDLAAWLPSLPWDAHKGRRAHLALVGGADGMSGAIALATRGALASGIGLAHAWVASPASAMLSAAVPQAITHAWPNAGAPDAPHGHALAMGPGLGREARARDLLVNTLAANPGVPAVLDADALTLLALGAATTGHEADTPTVAAQLRAWAGERPLVLTPHPGEFARLMGGPVPTDWEARGARVQQYADATGATILLKGTPTLIASPGHAAVTVVGRGTALLATGGSGDLLTGIVGTLLAQQLPPHRAAVLAATVHGLAAESATAAYGTTRGPDLSAVVAQLPAAWRAIAHPAPLPPGVLAEWPSVGT